MLFILTNAFVLYEIFLVTAKEFKLNHARWNVLGRTKLAKHINSSILLKYSSCVELIQLGRQPNACICFHIMCQSSH